MAPLVTMADIARIAGVTRQAVTNWRSRPAVEPFPSPVRRASGVERFNLDEVLEWLMQTGRGRNVDARLDAPAIFVPDDLDLDRAVVLLTLRGAAWEDLGPLTAAQRIALAEGIDRQDRFLLSEVREAAADDRTAEYVDGLLAATYGPGDALTRLYATRAARGDRGLSDGLLQMLQQIAGACRAFLGPDEVEVHLQLDPRARGVADGFAAAAPDCDRTMLRHLAIDELPIGSGTGPLVRVVSAVGMSDSDALELAGEISTELAEGQVAIILGPASALCDRQVGEPYEIRRDTLKGGNTGYGGSLAAAFRLPRGMWKEAHRQSLGIWILQGATTSGGTVVADLSRLDIETADLASDVLAALERTSARSYRYGRAVPYTEVWTRDTVVVLGIGAVRATTAAVGPSRHDLLIEATLLTREALQGFDLAVVPQRGVGTITPRSLNELMDSRLITLQNGCRIARVHTDAVGSIRVLSAGSAEPAGRIDPLVAAEHYSHAVRTEPGDVIFASTPRPHALVDEEGGSLVASPSRILRVRARAGIGPRALAATINTMEASSEWRAWQIPAVPRTQISLLEDAMGEAAAYLTSLQEHAEAAVDAITNLIQGVAEGSVALGSPSTEKEAV